MCSCLLGIKIILGDRQTLGFKEGELVKISFLMNDALMNDAVILNLKEPTSFQPVRIAPLQNDSIAAFIDTLDVI